MEDVVDLVAAEDAAGAAAAVAGAVRAADTSSVFLDRLDAAIGQLTERKVH